MVGHYSRASASRGACALYEGLGPSSPEQREWGVQRLHCGSVLQQRFVAHRLHCGSVLQQRFVAHRRWRWLWRTAAKVVAFEAMDRPYLNELTIRGYGCVRDATIKLTPLHALIGPNDSGKSTILRVVQTLAECATSRLSGPLLAALVAPSGGGGLRLAACVGKACWLVETADRQNFRESISPGPDFSSNLPTSSNLLRLNATQLTAPFSAALGGVRLFRLDPDHLREPSPLVVEGQPIQLDARGVGLAGALDAVVSRDIDAFSKIRHDVCRLFPSVSNLRLVNVANNKKALRIELQDGTQVGADFMSEGMLYYLAFAASPYLAPTPLLLIEEPENGLHPARIRDVMRVLREVSKNTQVLLATHSPLVVNELEPDEVTVVTRPSNEVGTQVVTLKDTPNFHERSSVHSLGELWVSYADGETEAPLLQGQPRE